VTLQAIPHSRRMDLALDLGCILVGMAGEAQGRGSGRDQLDVRNVFDGPNLVATIAAHRHGRMDRLALGLVFVASHASRRVGFGIERNWMLGGGNATGAS